MNFFVDNIYIYIFPYLIIPFFIFYRLKIYHTKLYNFEFLSKGNTDRIRGLLALVVILHHVAQRMDNVGLMLPFCQAGSYAVSIFLFFSGYGLMTSSLKNPNYFKNFFCKRISKVYIPFLIINIFTLSIYQLTFNSEYSLIDKLFYTTGIKLIDSVTWYIIITLVFYVIFYILFKNNQINVAVRRLFIYSLIFYFSCYIIKIGSWWYINSFSFPIGIYTAINFNKICSYIEKNYTKYTIFFILSFGILSSGIASFLLYQVFHFHFKVIIETLSSILFLPVVLLLLLKVDLRHNFLNFFGDISYEMYLIHMKIYIILGEFLQINKSYNILVYFIIVIMLSKGILLFEKLLLKTIHKNTYVIKYT
ncbi:conserved protein [Methanosarcina mazei Go1]|uniref:Conserved protein n=1 Tax=Methanosarcina mazei (strain ATCC BAA-159 / DSM 3647 / Goe1 / Go1 / JCM 11833 / OCM 88) TaxID=192952 RepID=Q8PV70_METMA|nr:conserved protein [Methanosarcina mazei Go1]